MTPVAYRRCLRCQALTPVAAEEAVWPLEQSCPQGHKIEQRDGIAMFAPSLADTVTGMDPAAFDGLAEIEANHFWFVTRNELIVSLVKKYFPHARHFMEIGCGNGTVLNALRLSRKWDRLVGSELHPSGLTHARKRMPLGVEFVQMDGNDIPARDAFDLTGAFDVIEHIPDDEAVLRGLRSATIPGGGIIVAVPQHPWLWSLADDIALHQRRYRRGELEAKLKRAGFQVMFSSSFTALLLPLMFLSRYTDKRTVEQFDFKREFLISPSVNSILKSILRIEIFLTRLGFRWPMGGSRIVIGRAI